ncbi:MAG: MASE4 domain-containing protein, partial [Rhodospirillales bacterium]|nr:MASE4 domain-containing protein [Rhodospirillales bacterium]
LLATGYLFDAQLTLGHALSFPGVFDEEGIFKAPQLTPWLYVLWHMSVPGIILAYVAVDVICGDRLLIAPRAATAWAMLVGLGGGALAVAAMAWVVDALPPLLEGSSRYARTGPGGVRIGLLIWTALPLIVLWFRRNRSTLDLWLLVVMATWACDFLTSTVISRQRWDLGFYVGRTYGLLAASFLLVAMVMRMKRLQHALVAALDEAEARNRELARSREEFARVQRFEAVGELVGGVGHDFKNILTVVIGSIDLIQGDPGNAAKVMRVSYTALDAARRGERLIQKLLSFAHRQVLHPTVVDLNRTIARLDVFLRRAAGEQAQFDLLCEPALWPVRCDVDEFESALLNLVLNAREAVAGQSNARISVLTRNVTLDAAEAAGMQGLTQGDHVVVAVRDNGRGMPAQVQARAFEPFFTTKSQGGGFGLGLSQVYGFATAAHGHVSIASREGEGSTVTLHLPRAREALSPDSATAKAAVCLPGGRETILVVEDDPAVCAVVVESLETLGYAVLVAHDMTQARAVLARRDRIDLLFSEMVLPEGGSGPALAAAARAMRPELRVLLTSGHAPADLARAFGPVCGEH